MAEQQVLTEDDLQGINEALEVIEISKATLLRAQQAGIDVTAQRARIEEQENKLLGIKRAFFPGR